jgi:hypothetical protein
MKRPTEAQLAAMRVNPNPRLVALMDYALDQVVAKLRYQDEFREWLEWAADWKREQRSPQACVDISHHCRERAKETGLVWPSLAQLAWGAKEACYSAPTSGWLVIRYIADAMCAFGIAFPDKTAVLLEPPTIDLERNNEPKLVN